MILEPDGGKAKVLNNSSDGTVGGKKSKYLIPVVILERMEANRGKIKVFNNSSDGNSDGGIATVN